jgi:hypothetical protein
MRRSPFSRFTLTLALLLPACGAEPSPESTAIVVQNAAGKVVIERAPFALHVEDASGATVLALASGRRTLGDRLYAPLVVSVGDEEEMRVPVLPGVPDTNPHDPVPAKRYAVTSVLAAHESEAGAELTLATDDPEGRTLALEVAPEQEDAFALRISASGGGAKAVALSFASSADEAFHGFGGRREGTNLRGRTIRNWVLDYRYPDVTPAYYDVAPFTVSSHGYGLLLDQDEYAVFRLATDAEDAWRLAVASPELRLLIAPGEASKAMGALSARTGRNRLPPAWSLGPTISRAVWVGKSALEYQQAIADDLDRIEADHLPVSAYCFEGWALLPEGFVASTIATLRARGIHPVLYAALLRGKGRGRHPAAGGLRRSDRQGLRGHEREGRALPLAEPFSRGHGGHRLHQPRRAHVVEG